MQRRAVHQRPEDPSEPQSFLPSDQSDESGVPGEARAATQRRQAAPGGSGTVGAATVCTAVGANIKKTQETSTRNQLPLNKKEGEKKTSAESHSHSHSVCRRRRRAPGRGINLNNSIREEHSGSAATRQSCQSVARIPRKERRRAPDYLLSAHIDPTPSM